MQAIHLIIKTIVVLYTSLQSACWLPSQHLAQIEVLLNEGIKALGSRDAISYYMFLYSAANMGLDEQQKLLIRKTCEFQGKLHLHTCLPGATLRNFTALAYLCTLHKLWLLPVVLDRALQCWLRLCGWIGSYSVMLGLRAIVAVFFPHKVFVAA